MLIGVAIGAAIHNVIPREWIENILDPKMVWSAFGGPSWRTDVRRYFRDIAGRRSPLQQGRWPRHSLDFYDECDSFISSVINHAAESR